MKQETIPKKSYGFRVAYDSLPRVAQKEVRDGIMIRLVISRGAFYHRMKGVIPSHPEFIIIKEEFEKYHILNVFDYERIDET